MNNYWMLLLLLQVIGLQCAEEVAKATEIEVLDVGQGENNDHFVGEIATDQNSIAYFAQHHGVNRIHDHIFKAITNPYGSLETIQALIDRYKLDISGLNYSTLSLLHYACWRTKDTVVLQFLLDKGADPEVKDEWIQDDVKFGGTALHWACKRKNVGAVKLLLNRDNINKEATDARGATPLHWACSAGNLEIVMALVKAGANLQAQDEDGNTPLHCAYKNYMNLLVSYLKRIGANTKITNNAGLTPQEVKEVEKACCIIL